MQVGVGLPNTLSGANRDLLLNWARLADAGPFSTLGTFDRLLYDSFEPLTTLAAAAAVTERIRLASTILIAPLHNPVLLAKTAATVDALSNGRFTLGLAVGAREDDYTAAAVPYQERGQRLLEHLATLRDIWEDERVGPRPWQANALQANGPELLVGGLTDITFARVARYADGYIHNGGPPPVFGRMAEKALAAWRDAGRPQRPRLYGMGYFAFGDDEAEAGRRYLRHYYDFTGPFAERIAQGLLTTPQAIVQFIRGYADAGCDELILFPTAGGLTQLERLGEVM
jgi:alkanesulfonate monooxygenase SsuD/methylene tetrahydromethanopterin reductase-like flavin-dependent oxidoreductase (luciferase family)